MTLSLALGIGALASIFSILNSLWLAPLPFAEPERLVTIKDFHLDATTGEQFAKASAHNFLEWKRRCAGFEALGAAWVEDFNLVTPGRPEWIRGAKVTSGLLEVLGVQPALGRNILPQEDLPGGAAVALMSSYLWKTRFGADPAVIGQGILIDGVSHQVIGILPEDLDYPRNTDLWIPLALSEEQTPQSFWHVLDVVGRLSEGTGIEGVRSELGAISAQLAAEFPNSNEGWGTRLRTMKDTLVGDFKPRLMLLSVAAAFILLIACANSGILLLAEARERQKEHAVRFALGATGWQVLRQQLIEKLLLAFICAALGLALAAGSNRVVTLFLGWEMGLRQPLRLDPSVIVFTVLLSIAVWMIFGILPLARNRRLSLVSATSRRTTTSVGARRFQNALVVIQVALAFSLLLVASLAILSYGNLLRIDPGFHKDSVLTLRIQLPANTEDHQRVTFFERAARQISGLPGVEKAGVTTTRPLAERNFRLMFSVEGLDQDENDVLIGNFRAISPDYFESMGIPLLAGRRFTSGDDERSFGAVIVNREMAERFWPGEDPVGKRIKRGSIGSENPWLQVIGVVEDIRDTRLDGTGDVTWYMPYPQFPLNIAFLTVHTRTDPRTLIPAVREEIWAIDRQQSVHDVASIDEVIENSIVDYGFNRLFSLCFAGVGTLLSILGIYSVLRYTVTQHYKEIGLRMAFGADSRRVVLDVLRKALGMVSVGLLVGFLLVITQTRLLTFKFYNVTVLDPVGYERCRIDASVDRPLGELSASTAGGQNQSDRDPTLRIEVPPIDTSPHHPDEVREHVRNHCPDLDVGPMTQIGEGLDFVVYRASSNGVGSLAIRVAKARHLSTEIDPATDARQLLVQEKTIMETMAAHGVPVPQVRELYIDSGDCDFLISDYIDNDGSEPGREKFGALLRAIHDVPPPPIDPVMQTEPTLAATLARRISRRAHLIEGEHDVTFALPTEDELREVAAWQPARPSLLHLDARSDNILCLRRAIRAIVDWSNALIGSPALDLARVAEFGYVARDGVLDRSFTGGYGDHHWHRDVPPAVELVFRLDTAVMLAVLFLMVLPDAQRGPEQIQRVRELARKLSGELATTWT